ncbi:hypothetical protein Tco_0692002 [Tanacetum coccineum]
MKNKAIVTPLLNVVTPSRLDSEGVRREFLATACAIIDCEKSKIVAGEGYIRRKSYDPRRNTNITDAQTPFYLENDFINTNAPGKWEIARGAQLNPFNGILVFRKTLEFLGAIPINLMGNKWETQDMFDDDWCWEKPPKEGDDGGHIKIEMIDPDRDKFDRVFRTIPNEEIIRKR